MEYVLPATGVPFVPLVFARKLRRFDVSPVNPTLTSTFTTATRLSLFPKSLGFLLRNGTKKQIRRKAMSQGRIFCVPTPVCHAF